MRLDNEHPINRLALARLRDPKRLRFRSEPITAPDEHEDPYFAAGAHPDIVERIWNDLNDSLPADCRAIVYGTPALVHPFAGVVLALAYGTAYAIRIPDDSIDDAIALGCRTEREWTSGGKTDIEDEFGRGWLFGAWLDKEVQWLGRVYRALDGSIQR